MRLSLAERAQTRLARVLVRLPRRLAGAPIVRDGHVLDGRSQVALWLARVMRRPPLHAGGVRSARHEVELSARALALDPGPAMASEVDRSLDTNAGPTRVRSYRPRGLSAPHAGLVYLHGGGFVLGSLDAYASLCRAIANRARCAVVSVDYRLAPEHRFPAAHDDAVAAFRAIAKSAHTFGIDPRRLAVGGDSAGGNLATTVALETRGDVVRPCLQLLAYPWLDMTLSSPSITTCGRGFFLERDSLDWFTEQYLSVPELARDPRVSPSLARDVADSPRAIVMTAGFDPLCDEGDAYAARLRAAGVEVEHRRYPSLIHGFLAMAGVVDDARAAFDDATAALRRAFACQ